MSSDDAAPPLSARDPSPAGAFLGRDADLAALRSAFDSERLVTLLGPPGVGKTSLAHQFMVAASGEYGERFFFCDLTEARGLEDVVQSVARGLGVPLSPANLESGITQIHNVLRARRRALVVLDNFEQVVDEAATTVGRWLEADVEVRFLITSRERLRLRHEHVHELSPLSVPPHGDDAVRLFHARACAVMGRPLDDDQAGAVEEIVRELDGLPLAIVLAAARLRVLTPTQLLANLPQRLAVLTSGSRDTAAHHRTLRDAIASSYSPLAPWEQAAIARASVFRGGFSLEAAEAVLDLARFAGAPPTLDVVERLRDTSLLRADRAGAGVRFGLYVAIREFADAELDPGDRAAAYARHAAYFAGLSAAWPGGAVASVPTAELELERDNLVAVVERGVSGAVDLQQGFEALAALEPLLAVRGPYTSYLALLDAALDACGAPALSPRLLARAYGARGRMRALLGRSQEAESDLRQAVAYARASTEPLLEGRCLNLLGYSLFRDKPDEARAAYAEALACLEPSGDALALGDNLSLVGSLHRARGDLVAARAALERGCRLLATTSDRRTYARALSSLGLVDLDEQRLEEAYRHLVEARDLLAALGDRHGTANNRGNAGCVLQELGRFDEARSAYVEALEELGQVGGRQAEGVFLLWQGTLHHECGDIAAACAAYEQALAVLGAAGQRRDEGAAFGYLGAARAALGQRAEAEEAFQQAHRRLTEARDSLGLAVLELDRGHLDRVEGREDAVAARLAAGRASTGRSARARLSMRLLQACRARASSGRELLLGLEASWFRMSGGARVDLARRTNLRRLLQALADEHTRAPGRPLRTAELLSIGWPSDRMAKDLGANRVHVAIATLRRLGLGEAIVRQRGGWLLDPALTVVMAYRQT